MINLNLVSSRCLIIINSSSNYHIRSSPFHRRFSGSFLPFSVSCSFFSRDVSRIRPYYTYTYYFPVYGGVKYTFFFFLITIIVCHLFKWSFWYWLFIFSYVCRYFLIRLAGLLKHQLRTLLGTILDRTWIKFYNELNSIKLIL